MRWLYSTEVVTGLPAQEIILDINLGAFYTATISQIGGLASPKPVSMVKVPPFAIGDEGLNVVSSSSDAVVDSSGNMVTVTRGAQINAVSEVLYVTSVPSPSAYLNFTFSYYYNTEFTDWLSYNGIGIDSPGFLITGWTGFGDFQRMKQIPYLTVYSLKTESGFDAQYNPVNTSSILVQSQWSWTNSEASGKWSAPFQAYRHKRFWAPESSDSGFDDGEYVIKTRNKLRGRGNVLSLKFSTEPKKDFKLLGWSYIINANGHA